MHPLILSVTLILSLLAAACAPPGTPREAADTLATPSPPATVSKQEQADGHRPRLEVSGIISNMPSKILGLTRIRAPAEPLDRENYAHFQENPVQRAAEQPVSTFSIDVDTGAYANVRRFLNQGRLPPQDAVRVEELINYFSYDYPLPESMDPPFSVSTELATSPWNPHTRLLHVGIQGWKPPRDALPAANLVLLVDVSGSMRSPNKLGLLKSALKLLVGQLDGEDRISLVVYAGAAGVVLAPTSGDRRGEIVAALDSLTAGGSTNGGAGIHLAYALAKQGFIPGGVNRVILATDGDFNVGTVNFESLKDLVARQRASGVALTTLGFGAGNYNDQLMEQLADVGDGNYAYIDTLQEARKVLVEQLGATLHTIARDVKIQIEFNPALVEEYRLIGYENRVLNREDFNNDAVDAGDIGAGHTVTALYEIALKGQGGAWSDPLRYAAEPAAGDHAGELAWLRLRYKQPDQEGSRLLEQPIPAAANAAPGSERLRFAAAVAAYGQLLRGGRYTNGFDFDQVLALAREARGEDPQGYRGEFLGLLALARDLSRGETQVTR